MADIVWFDGFVEEKPLGFCAVFDGKHYSIPRRLCEGLERGDRVSFTLRKGKRKRNPFYVDKLLLRP